MPPVIHIPPQPITKFPVSCPLSCTESYQDNAPLLPQNGDGVLVDCDRDRFGHGDLALGPPLILHVNLKGRKGVGPCAALNQGVGAVALEVKGEAVKGEIVRVADHMASPAPLGGQSMAPLDAIHHTALFARATGGTLALNDAAHLANAPLLAEAVDVEGLARLVVEALVDAAALGDGHTLVVAQNVALVALAALPAFGGAEDGVEEAAACHGAVAGAYFVVAVGGTVWL